MALLDEGGLRKLTLRRLADRLGVRAPTLYWHVRDKRHLLDLIADAILVEAFLSDVTAPPEGGSPWEALRQIAVALRRALLAHPDGALVVAGNRPSSASLSYIDREIGRLVHVGFNPTEALDIQLAIGAYVMGSVIDSQAEAARPPDPPNAEPASPDQEMLPYLAAAGYPDPQDRFDRGLDYLIAGFQARAKNRAAAD